MYLVPSCKEPLETFRVKPRAELSRTTCRYVLPGSPTPELRRPLARVFRSPTSSPAELSGVVSLTAGELMWGKNLWEGDLGKFLLESLVLSLDSEGESDEAPARLEVILDVEYILYSAGK